MIWMSLVWASDPVVVSLEPMTSRRFGVAAADQDVDARPSGPPHPRPVEGAWYRSVVWGGGRVHVQVKPSANGRFQASADLNADGELGLGEVAMLKAPSMGADPIAELTSVVDRSGDKVYASLSVKTSERGGKRVIGARTERLARGTFPDGTSFLVRGEQGFFDTSGSVIVVDADGDGAPDQTNALARYSLREGVVASATATYQVTFKRTPAGPTLWVEETDAEPTGIHVGSKAPAFELKASDGKTHRLEDYRGRMLILDFWATWCGPCVAAHPKVEAFAEKMDAALLGVSSDTDQKMLNRWLKKRGTTWPSGVQGPKGPVVKAYGVNSWPTYALIDEEGRMVGMAHDFRSLEVALKAYLER